MAKNGIKAEMVCEKCDSYTLICPTCETDGFLAVKDNEITEIYCENALDGCGWCWNTESLCPKCNDGEIDSIKLLM